MTYVGIGTCDNSDNINCHIFTFLQFFRVTLFDVTFVTFRRHFCHIFKEIVGLAEDPDSTNLKCKMFGGFSYDIQLNTTNPEDMDNLDELLNFDWMDHVANQMEIEMAIQMERKYPKQQNRKVYIDFFYFGPKFPKITDFLKNPLFLK